MYNNIWALIYLLSCGFYVMHPRGKRFKVVWGGFYFHACLWGSVGFGKDWRLLYKVDVCKVGGSEEKRALVAAVFYSFV